MAAPAGAQVGAVSIELRIKAAFLYNFARFIEWPAHVLEQQPATIVVGILGRDPFGTILEQTFRDKTVHGRTFEVRRIRSVPEITECHIVYVSPSEHRNVDSIVLAAAEGGVLTVSHLDEFAERGGMINFVLEDNRIRFEVNLLAAQQAGFRFHAQLLQLARAVHREIRRREK
ncbi:MAG: YfiR family protein [Bryobacteraceae bacterium]